MERIKTLIAIVICTLAINMQSTIAQTAQPKFSTTNNSSFDVWVELKNKDKLKGQLLSISDDQMALIDKNGNLHQVTYSNNLINLQLRKKHARKKGFAIGAIVGAVIGVSAGYLSGDDKSSFFSHTAKDKAGIYGTLGFLTGGLFGYQVGKLRFNVYLNGKDKLNQSQLKFLKLKGLTPY